MCLFLTINCCYLLTVLKVNFHIIISPILYIICNAATFFHFFNYHNCTSQSLLQVWSFQFIISIFVIQSMVDWKQNIFDFRLTYASVCRSINYTELGLCKLMKSETNKSLRLNCTIFHCQEDEALQITCYPVLYVNIHQS